MKQLDKIKVSSITDTKKLASAIVMSVKKKKLPQLIAVGIEATSKAIRSVAIARGYLLAENISLVAEPHFENLIMPDGSEKTAIVITLPYSKILPITEQEEKVEN